ncbi:NTP transferase domain-containing protein [Nesterenkonia alkaliphila]|uniref:NTP transferase domain-containing protein n=1 Tax=Nesterenkonia alkaliphila TaxID=1463631 RepID=A0A7K1ULQ2_9MICC|nr:NTP transferase domain-containing protein [Nesterenkonia alkaliphila]MVT27262.1 NTP transferase domain-containing protein [Nesterenkonia alkaliphila]GFZ78230.1 hypothetical protein GCM10011359_03050 [Nesterenkonia alkaliphila]
MVAGRDVQAVLLAGGAGTRLGGADKALLIHRGRTLLEHWGAALAERGVGTAVVGGEHLRPQLPAGFRLTREDPPLSGPAAAVCAGVRALPPVEGTPAHTVLLLSVDTVDPGPLLDWLAGWLPPVSAAGEQATVPRDREGRFQMLSAAVSGAWLRRRVAALSPGQETGQSLRWLLKGARTVHPVLPAGLGRDVDDHQDARALGIDL